MNTKRSNYESLGLNICPHHVSYNNKCIVCGIVTDSEMKIYSSLKNRDGITVSNILDLRSKYKEDHIFLIELLKKNLYVEKSGKEMILKLGSNSVDEFKPVVLEEMIGKGHILYNPQHLLDLERSGVDLIWKEGDHTVVMVQGNNRFEVDYITYGINYNGIVIDYDSMVNLKENI